MRRKLLCLLSALLFVCLLFTASAENLGELLGSGENRAVGDEARVYQALHGVLAAANGGELPLGEWSDVMTYLAKMGIGEPLSPGEQVFDQSVSAYEKFFLLQLNTSTLEDEQIEALTALFADAEAALPEDGADLYLSADGNAFMPELMRQALELLGWQCAPEEMDDAVSLYAIQNGSGETVLSAEEILPTLPGAMLMKHVPMEKRESSAAAFSSLAMAAPRAINWALVASADDAFFAEFVGEQADAVAADEDAAAKWLGLLFACDAYDAEARAHAVGEGVNRVREAVKAIAGDEIEVVAEPEDGISLRLASAVEPTAEPTARPTAAPTTASTAQPQDKTAAPTATAAADAGMTAKPTPTPKPTPTVKPTATPYVDSYNLSYVIYVSKNSHTIAILSRDGKGEYTRLVRAFSTGIGRAGQTRAGTYTITSKERWHSWGKSYSPYASRHSGGLYVHGPLYSAKDSNKMQPGSYNAIGTNCSSGCLRTTCSAAAWVYYNCPVGTRIIIANDSKYSAARPAQIPANQRYDPTDPGAKPEIPITDFTISPAELTLQPGETAALSISGICPAENSTGNDFKYASSDAAVAAVSEGGVVTAIAPGACHITVTANDVGGYSRSVAVTVSEPAPTETPEPTETPAPSAEPEATPTAASTEAPAETAAPTEEPAETETPAPTEAPAETESPEETPAPTEAPTTAPEITEAPTEAPKPTEAPAPTEASKPAEEAPKPVEEAPEG